MDKNELQSALVPLTLEHLLPRSSPLCVYLLFIKGSRLYALMFSVYRTVNPV